MPKPFQEFCIKHDHGACLPSLPLREALHTSMYGCCLEDLSQYAPALLLLLVTFSYILTTQASPDCYSMFQIAGQCDA